MVVEDHRLSRRRVPLPAPVPDSLLKGSDVARRLNVSEGMVENLSAAGYLPKKHLGKAVRYHPADVERLMSHGTEPAEDAAYRAYLDRIVKSHGPGRLAAADVLAKLDAQEHDLVTPADWRNLGKAAGGGQQWPLPL